MLLLIILRKHKVLISFILCIAILNLTSCFYYKVRTLKNNRLVNENLAGKYVIVHVGGEVWHLSKISMNADKMEISGFKNELSEDHNYYKKTNSDEVNRYKKKEGNPTYEVHFYLSSYLEGSDDFLVIPLSSVTKVEMYDKDVGATVMSHVVIITGISAAIFALFIIIVALLKSSCPFVYVNTGAQTTFSGEMFGGAISKPLERDDYMPLPELIAKNGVYELKIANELKEKQYTDMAELMVVHHPAGSRVVVDAHGVLQTITEPMAPIQAVSGNSVDQKELISKRDNNGFMFNLEEKNNPDISTLNLSFQKPAQGSQGKLVLHAKNSLWFDYMYGEFTKQFGTFYPKFAEKQKSVPAAQSKQWALDQNIPLSVYIETEKGWEFVDYFNTTGPLASRDLVMSLDLSKVKGEKVNVRLESGFMFWEVDYAAMDFTPNANFQLDYLSASSAVDENGKDVSSSLKSSDGNYLFQPKVGNRAMLKFTKPIDKVQMEQSCFLHSRGYYEYIRDFKNKPDMAYLKTFRNKGAFTRFTKENYTKMVTDPAFYEKALVEGTGELEKK